ncbi:helix-hairpin-helix domain-containing protein [Fictibacillus aquaticus]|uniref:Helix-hairpin-helix DNA-binding motif class 1 domain-containing protein n=1 Tax=Fictibacillus aquaticus TaxID=2021314 RepID=A0A235FAN2_9BACL|nr:helix-hairpin-helix domain-containing protein [Fictibacillus aquaticus]OYD57977.1 hypothetical protein CGZ90_08790 [Fictibacillus aquaticus]
MVNYFREHMKKAGIAGLLLLLFAIYLYSGHTDKKEEVQEDVMPISQKLAEDDAKAEKGELKTKIPAAVWVDVKGEVGKPGVYQGKPGERVMHFIQMAGGFTKNADPKSVNLAAVAVDEMVIYAAKKGEQLPPSSIGTSVSTGGSKGISIIINSATKEELMELPGVGPAKADAIISYRDANGPFSTFEDLLEVRGIGEKTAEQWKEMIIFTH